MSSQRDLDHKEVNRRRNDLIAIARHVRENAYAPYSGFKVGAAVLTRSGIIYTGCNVENATFGATVCAERNAIGALVAAGGSHPIGCAVFTDAAKPAPPCGICRQVLSEFNSDLLVISMNVAGDVVEWDLGALLPFTFDGSKLKR